MNKIKIFIGSVCLVLAIGAIAATKATSKVAPEYYLNNDGLCVVAPTPVCGGGPVACRKIISGQGATPKQIFDNFVSVTECSTPLTSQQ